jgi:hypothetical protein
MLAFLAPSAVSLIEGGLLPGAPLRSTPGFHMAGLQPLRGVFHVLWVFDC